MPLAPLLRSVHLENFKGVHAMTVDFERLTVLVGPNAIGKTSILEGVLVAGFLAQRLLP